MVGKVFYLLFFVSFEDLFWWIDVENKYLFKYE